MGRPNPVSLEDDDAACFSECRSDERHGGACFSDSRSDERQQDTTMKEAQHDLTCGICFEDASANGGVVSLPCACRISYCSPCWDRALLVKYQQTRRAECPSCRSSMWVDFDAEVGKLSFRKLGDRSGPDSNMRERLYDQARPWQVTLLKRHGAESAQEGCGSPSAPCPGPACVCGNQLSRCSMQDRLYTFKAGQYGITVEAAKTDADLASYVQKCLEGSLKMPITCDICDEKPFPTEDVWTCKAGSDSLLHSLSYDVCDRCYSEHVFGKKSSLDAKHVD